MYAICLAVGAALALTFVVPAAACEIGNAEACPHAGGSGATISQRLKAVENTVQRKTGHYEVRRMNRSKTWGPKRFRASSASGSVGHWTDIAIESEHPIETRVWLELSATYSSSVDFLVVLQIGLAQEGCNDCYDSSQLWCKPRKMITAPGSGSHTLSVKAFCRGVVNAQSGEKLRVGAILAGQGGDVTVESMTLSSRLINDVITEFE